MISPRSRKYDIENPPNILLIMDEELESTMNPPHVDKTSDDDIPVLQVEELEKIVVASSPTIVATYVAGDNEQEQQEYEEFDEECTDIEVPLNDNDNRQPLHKRIFDKKKRELLLDSEYYIQESISSTEDEMSSGSFEEEEEGNETEDVALSDEKEVTLFFKRHPEYFAWWCDVDY